MPYRWLAAAVLPFFLGGCPLPESGPEAALGCRYCAGVPGGPAAGTMLHWGPVLWESAGGPAAALEAAWTAGGTFALGLSVRSGPEPFYLWAGRTPPAFLEYAAPFLRLGAGLAAGGGLGAYGEVEAGACFFLPERVRLLAGYAWGLGREGGYRGLRAGLEVLY